MTFDDMTFDEIPGDQVPVDQDLEARIEAASALRELSHAFVSHDASAATFARISERARTSIAELQAGSARDRLALMQAGMALQVESGSPARDMMRGGAGFEDRAVAGKANPSGVEISTREFADIITVDVVFRKANEGPPGRAHGGMVSAVFDDVTGYVIGRLERPAFTGELTVRLVAPVPLNTPLLFRTWLDREDGRKLYIHAEALDGDTVVATCKAIYIAVDPTMFVGIASTVDVG